MARRYSTKEKNSESPATITKNTVNSVAWKRLRKHELNHDHHSFGEHDALVDLIEERDTEAAAALMRDHLRAVRRDLLASMPD